ncbi:hypothetical protein E2C01_029866 [Portunus trituberculatus]|uniref:Uncharacterized protein n=1 Tax=Portunus trituberculatus TaxID=210409 RepID=A0A5B7ETK3_PORTR|nr:hypothetical protein [Portunus trituberculatus]
MVRREPASERQEGMIKPAPPVCRKCGYVREEARVTGARGPQRRGLGVRVPRASNRVGGEVNGVFAFCVTGRAAGSSREGLAFTGAIEWYLRWPSLSGGREGEIT